MAKKRPKPQESADVTPTTEARGSRHLHRNQVNVEDDVYQQLRAYQADYTEKHGLRPTLTSIVRLALTELLRGRGFWPPPPPKAPPPN